MIEVNDDIRVVDRNVPAHRKGRALRVSVRARQVRRALAKLVRFPSHLETGDYTVAGRGLFPRFVGVALRGHPVRTG